MLHTNFTQCQIDWQPRLAANTTLQELYGWHGPVQHIPKNATTQISTHGCLVLCGNGADFYPWSQTSATITTWVLPIIGVLAQAPFESNKFWATVFTTARWIGSPMASLAYILWNIRVSGKAALMVDMSTRYNNYETNPETEFGSIRDSFYLLMTMNQYAFNPAIRTKREAAGLLRIALFSKDLRLLRKDKEPPKPDLSSPAPWPSARRDSHRSRNGLSATAGLDEKCEPEGHLNDFRQKLALQLRQSRRRGVIPVFVSILWFLFSMAISIQSSFGYLGSNQTAHDLALGCLLAWLPVLILCSIVDRNPVSSNDVQEKLNKFVHRVRASLEDEDIRHQYINCIAHTAQHEEMNRWTEKIAIACAKMQNEDFFTTFAGQGRSRWHYGIAHPILTDIESAYIKNEGRDWLSEEVEARNFLVLGKVEGGLDWFDYRELWQVAAAISIVFGCSFGAWMISYYTPTVGLGCRSGSYTVFLSVALFLLLIEMVTWWLFDAQKRVMKAITRRISTDLRERMQSFSGLHRSKSAQLVGTPRSIARALFSFLALLTGVPENDEPEVLAGRHQEIQRKVEIFFFRPLEILNALWLLYFTMAQTVGADNTCACMTSTWAKGGGYLDFTQWNVANSNYVDHFWIAGTSISVSVMGISMLYVVMEYILQSHLSTTDMDEAAKSLRSTRRFRYVVYSMLFGAADAMSSTSLRWHANIWCKNAAHVHSGHRPRPSKTAPAAQTPKVADMDSDDVRDPGHLSGGRGSDVPKLFPPARAYTLSRSNSGISPTATETVEEEYSSDDGRLAPSWRAGYPRRSSNEPGDGDVELGLMGDRGR